MVGVNPLWRQAVEYERHPGPEVSQPVHPARRGGSAQALAQLSSEVVAVPTTYMQREGREKSLLSGGKPGARKGRNPLLSGGGGEPGARKETSLIFRGGEEVK